MNKSPPHRKSAFAVDAECPTHARPAAALVSGKTEQPAYGRIRAAVQTYGVSRSWLYREAPNNPGLLVKAGRTTLVSFEVLRRILASLPQASIGQNKRAS
jgi:hypothetical protein